MKTLSRPFTFFEGTPQEIKSEDFKGYLWGVVANGAEAWISRLPFDLIEGKSSLRRHSILSSQIDDIQEGDRTWRCVGCAASAYATAGYTENYGDDYVWFQLHFQALDDFGRTNPRAGLARARVHDAFDSWHNDNQSAILDNLSVWLLPDGESWDSEEKMLHHYSGLGTIRTCVGKDFLAYLDRNRANSNMTISVYSVGSTTPSTWTVPNGENCNVADEWQPVTVCPHAFPLALFMKIEDNSNDDITAFTRFFRVAPLQPNGNPEEGDAAGNVSLNPGVWPYTCSVRNDHPEGITISYSTTKVTVLDWVSGGSFIPVEFSDGTKLYEGYEYPQGNAPAGIPNPIIRTEYKYECGGIVSKRGILNDLGGLIRSQTFEFTIGNGDDSSNLGRGEENHLGASESAGDGPMRSSGFFTQHPTEFVNHPCMRIFTASTNAFSIPGQVIRQDELLGDLFYETAGVRAPSFRLICNLIDSENYMYTHTFQIGSEHPIVVASVIIDIDEVIAAYFTGRFTIDDNDPWWWPTYETWFPKIGEPPVDVESLSGNQIIIPKSRDVPNYHTLAWEDWNYEPPDDREYFTDYGGLGPAPRPNADVTNVYTGYWWDTDGNLKTSPLAFDASVDKYHPNATEYRGAYGG